MEICFDLEQFLEDQRAGLARQFLEREHLDVVVVEPQKTPVGFDLRIAELKVEIAAAVQTGIANL